MPQSWTTAEELLVVPRTTKRAKEYIIKHRMPSGDVDAVAEMRKVSARVVKTRQPSNRSQSGTAAAMRAAKGSNFSVDSSPGADS